MLVSRAIRVVGRLKKPLELRRCLFRNNTLLSSKLKSVPKVGAFTALGVCYATEANSKTVSNKICVNDKDLANEKSKVVELVETIMMIVYKAVVLPLTTVLEGIASVVDLLFDLSSIRNVITLCFFPLLPLFVFDCCMKDKEFFAPVKLYKKHLLNWLFCASFAFFFYTNSF